jgi:hypothetical protein
LPVFKFQLPDALMLCCQGLANAVLPQLLGFQLAIQRLTALSPSSMSLHT